MSSYYDAIAARDYARAYGYWESGAPGHTLAEFAAGFAGTANVGVVVPLSFYTGVAAGSAYAETPVLLTATDNGVAQTFVGCLVARRVNVPVNGDPNWHLYSADFRAVSSFDAGLYEVWGVCQGANSAPPPVFACAPRSDWPLYTVRTGDTLRSVARWAGTTSDVLVAANCLPDPNRLLVGQQIHVPIW